jgi:hypothetical protein
MSDAFKTLAQELTEITAKFEGERKAAIDGALDAREEYYRGRGESGDVHVVYADRDLAQCQREPVTERCDAGTAVTCGWCVTWLYA